MVPPRVFFGKKGEHPIPERIETTLLRDLHLFNTSIILCYFRILVKRRMRSKLLNLEQHINSRFPFRLFDGFPDIKGTNCLQDERVGEEDSVNPFVEPLPSLTVLEKKIVVNASQKGRG